MQPKQYSSPRIALLNVELELKAEKENAELRIDNVQVLRSSFLRWAFIRDAALAIAFVQ